MSVFFAEWLTPALVKDTQRRLAEATASQVRRALERPRLQASDAPLLFSAAAEDFLEEMAQRALRLTRLRFGRTAVLYAPLYVSNHCLNGCRYCGFAAGRRIERLSLTAEEAEREAAELLRQGIRHLLLVSGEAPEQYGLDRVLEVVRRLRPKTASLSVEIFPCSLSAYRQLVEAGVDGLVLYQETYQRELYAQVHPYGPKRDFVARLTAIEAGGQAGLRSLGVGTLLGLGEPRLEACLLVRHAEWLGQRFPRSRLALSFPRLRPVPGGLGALHPASDRELAQFIVGSRLMLPDAELVLSTREPAALRDRLLGLGVTRISAGSRTSPGGYSGRVTDADAGQFETEDRRSVAEVIRAVRQAGLDPVTKDFDAGFLLERNA